MKVYAVANLKGSVGKTTTTVNVAYTFSEMGGRVLVIDLDPQCNCTRFFAKVNGYSKTVRDFIIFLVPIVVPSKLLNQILSSFLCWTMKFSTR